MASCKECEEQWTGLKMAHCSQPSCCQTFSCVAHFDAHRKPISVRGNSHRGPMSKCVDPSSLLDKNDLPLLKQNDRGVWVGAHERPEETDD